MTRAVLLRIIVVVCSFVPLLAQAPERQVRGQAAQTPPPVVPSDTAATVAGRPISTRQIDDTLGSRLIQVRTQEYRLRKSALDELVATALFDKEAAARKMTTADLVATEIEAKTKPVTEEEARAVLDSARDRMGPVSDDEAIKTITAGMRRQRVAQRRAEFAGELKTKYAVELLLQPPRFTVRPTAGPTLGPADAPVTLVEFSDFQCPYCARASATVKQVMAKYPGKVRLVFQDFPLPMHKDAAKAAEAGACAQDQGKFWDMHDRLFQNQNNLSVPDLKRHAADLGLDAAAFAACLDGGRHAVDARRTVALGQSYGVSGTPSFFVNGIPMTGAVPLQEFTQTIDDELVRAAAPAKPAEPRQKRP